MTHNTERMHTYIHTVYGISNFFKVNILDYFLIDALAGNMIYFVYQNYYLQEWKKYSEDLSLVGPETVFIGK